MSIQSSHKPPNWVIFLLLIMIGLLFLGIFRGCKQSLWFSDREKDSLIDTLQARLRYNDSIGKENKRNYDGVMEYANGIIDLRNNRIEEVEHENDSLNNAIASLKKRYKPVTVSVDTNITTVPNEYIQDCADCFLFLDKSKELTLKLRAEQDNLNAAYKTKSNIQENRIKELGLEKTQLNNTLTSTLKVVSEYEDKNKPRRKLLFSMNAIAINATYPTGLGAGLIYQDKLNRLYGGHVFGTNVGPVYMAQFALPLSLRNKK